ncbi:MAG: LytTR family DNA-binding domain-containing protein [Bacteroidota bacterium]
MTKIKVIIIDDEALARTLITTYMERIPHLELAGSFKNPLAAIQCLQTQAIDLIFLDIQMPQLTGIEFLKTLHHQPQIVLTTAYSEYALEGYVLNVTDYLLKPFSFERFLQAVNKSSEQIELKRNQKTTASLPEATASKGYQIVKAEHKVHRIYHDDILYIQSMQEYVAYYTNHGRVIAFGALKKLELELPNPPFMRIHKSYIINADKASTLEGNLVHIGTEKIPIGGSYREQVKSNLFQ